MNVSKLRLMECRFERVSESVSLKQASFSETTANDGLTNHLPAARPGGRGGGACVSHLLTVVQNQK